LFEDCSKQLHDKSSKTVEIVREIHKPGSHTYFSQCFHPLYNWDIPVGFFYGAQQNNLCGTGIVLKINSIHCYKLQLVVGIGSNTRE